MDATPYPTALFAPLFLLCGEDVVGPVIVHPCEVLPATVDDPERVGYGHALLSDDLHPARVDLVDVFEPHDDPVRNRPRLGWPLRLQFETKHLTLLILVGLVETILTWVHHVVGVQCPFDALHHVESAPHLPWDELRVALARRSVTRGDRAAVLQRYLSDLLLALHPGIPHGVIQSLLPDPDVDLDEVIRPRLMSAVRVSEHAPVVEDSVVVDVALCDCVPLLAHHRQCAVGDGCILTVPAHRHDLPFGCPSVQGSRIAVVAGGPVAPRDLVAKIVVTSI